MSVSVPKQQHTLLHKDGILVRAELIDTTHAVLRFNVPCAAGPFEHALRTFKIQVSEVTLKPNESDYHKAVFTYKQRVSDLWDLVKSFSETAAQQMLFIVDVQAFDRPPKEGEKKQWHDNLKGFIDSKSTKFSLMYARGYRGYQTWNLKLYAFKHKQQGHQDEDAQEGWDKGIDLFISMQAE